jgi:hypothetical protein
MNSNFPLPPLRISFPLFVSFLVALEFFLPSPGLAVCPVPKVQANGEFFKANVVFVGRVLSIRTVPDRGNDLGGWLYRLRVEELFRGPVRDDFSVFTENSSGRFPLELDHEYLLFAYKQNHRLEIHGCGNSAKLSEAQNSLHRLLRNLRDGKQPTEIEGWVAAETSGIDVSGITITIKSRARNYTAVTDQDGWFHFIAPPGLYQVDFSSDEYYLNGADFYWYDSKNFVLHPGECASLQFVSVRQLAK